ncbi:MAG: hypothetical protein P9X24_18090 [Candidatus Hatepunaea meridiana]|nr:hypothetical protein [Candidatus Hatepunaea meridiana]
MSNTTLYTFLLGGYDAEMCTIREMLVEHNLPFIEKKLSWGAKVSDYADEISKCSDRIIVSIELIEDISLPVGAIVIDHHNDKAGKDKPTSIEQIASLLGIRLNRRQTLIAANDRAYIPGLISAGATHQEIDDVRSYDRCCQGVNEAEEKQAQQLCDNFQTEGKLDILDIPFKRTSPVVDRLHGRFTNLLITTPETINLFGEGRSILKLAAEFKDGWYGGNLPDRGFWGMVIKPTTDINYIKNFVRKLL